MDSRIVVRFSVEEKEDLMEISSDLNLTLSSYIREKLLGGNLENNYLVFINNRLNQYNEGQVFTLKELLGKHWNYMSKHERLHLLNVIIEEIEEEEMEMDIYKVTKKGKYKFIKSKDSYYINELIEKYMEAD
ncbi:DUF1413 domain-containing protein [Bacillus paranthracis]|uniref:DUF1413 domain-containing protein n=1 Tax=Bacillus cereus group TaxID=86661 RepID=UPI0013D7E7AD|nr:MULTISPECIES: DUF1413 domain-containing protein [Bacillus cereus group]MCY9249709.1 DUF1413 domain-containing protein [Bacillus paranthracis]MDA1499645.1 DUF1413 domain-containing protein [Bacillus cereus group sp. TH41-1LC]MDA1661242.1 DUF1413 domain-containing protein [Bacillus cereus group sp. TH153LC]MDA1929570.1 DUF1413 domain-containing protein [Bacillus cereus group sp. BcHK130]MDK7424871.1 DUF1413 domain-containing protein [Bacillus paranthracis]